MESSLSHTLPLTRRSLSPVPPLLLLPLRLPLPLLPLSGALPILLLLRRRFRLPPPPPPLPLPSSCLFKAVFPSPPLRLAPFPLFPLSPPLCRCHVTLPLISPSRSTSTPSARPHRRTLRHPSRRHLASSSSSSSSSNIAVVASSHSNSCLIPFTQSISVPFPPPRPPPLPSALGSSPIPPPPLLRCLSLPPKAVSLSLHPSSRSSPPSCTRRLRSHRHSSRPIRPVRLTLLHHLLRQRTMRW